MINSNEYYLSGKLNFDSLYIYRTYLTNRKSNKGREKSNLNLKDNKRKTEISKKSRNKLKTSLKYLLYFSREKKVYNRKSTKNFIFKVNFITLTLSSKQNHTDNVIKNKLLNQFLIEAKKRWNVTNYIWRSELQKNGNIHFHILTDKFIPWLELRNTWNRIQEKLRYITEFEHIHKHRNPNSTDIHSLKKIKNINAYITKYMSKSGEDSGNKGRNWGCSTKLSNMKGTTIEIDESYLKELEYLRQHKTTKIYNNDFVTSIYFDCRHISLKQTPNLYKTISNYIISIFGEKQLRLIYPDFVPS